MEELSSVSVDKAVVSGSTEVGRRSKSLVHSVVTFTPVSVKLHLQKLSNDYYNIKTLKIENFNFISKSSFCRQVEYIF